MEEHHQREAVRVPSSRRIRSPTNAREVSETVSRSNAYGMIARKYSPQSVRSEDQNQRTDRVASARQDVAVPRTICAWIGRQRGEHAIEHEGSHGDDANDHARHVRNRLRGTATKSAMHDEIPHIRRRAPSRNVMKSFSRSSSAVASIEVTRSRFGRLGADGCSSGVAAPGVLSGHDSHVSGLRVRHTGNRPGFRGLRPAEAWRLASMMRLRAGDGSRVTAS